MNDGHRVAFGAVAGVDIDATVDAPAKVNTGAGYPAPCTRQPATGNRRSWALDVDGRPKHIISPKIVIVVAR